MTNKSATQVTQDYRMTTQATVAATFENAEHAAAAQEMLDEQIREIEQKLAPVTAYIKWDHSEEKWKGWFNGRAITHNSSKAYGAKLIKESIEQGKAKKFKDLGIQRGVIVGDDFHVSVAPTTAEISEMLAGEPVQQHGANYSLTSEFSITERFGILESFVQSATNMAVAEEGSPEYLSANPLVVVTGSGGLGKTHTTMEVIKRNGLESADDMEIGSVLYGTAKGYRVINGYSTAKALYRKLWEHREGWVIVLDDCDSVLKSADAVNILKGAGDSGDRRMICWNAESVRPDDDLPRSFEFKSSIIIISNIDRQSIPQPIRSRAMNADVSMSRAEVVERVKFLTEKGTFMAEYPMQAKNDVIAFVESQLDDTKFNTLVRSLNMRTFIVAVKAWVQNGGQDWQRMALYNMASSSED
jgi:hypothetical protein